MSKNNNEAKLISLRTTGKGYGFGFLLFYVPYDRKYELIKHLKCSGIKIFPFSFDELGLQSWTVREAEKILKL